MRQIILLSCLFVVFSTASENPSKLEIFNQNLLPQILEPILNSHLTENLRGTQQARDILQTIIKENLIGINPVSVDDDILAFLEKIRDGMGAPNEELGLPTLDPLSLKTVNLDFEFALLILKGIFTDITVTDLSKFQVSHVHLALIPPSFTINMTLPTLRAVGLYEADGVLFNNITYNGKGNFDFNITDFQFNVSVKIDFLPNAHLNISHVDFSFHMGGIHVNITGLKGDEDNFETIFNDLINEEGAEQMNIHQEEVSQDAINTILKIGNGFLNNMTLQDLLDLIHGKRIL